MVDKVLMGLIIFLTFFCMVKMVLGLRKQAKVFISVGEYVKLGFSGCIAFIADTLGIGSFAVNVALSKLLGTFKDEELPAVNNGAQVLPGLLESWFFMQLIAVDPITLLTLVGGTALGGLLGASVVSHLPRQAIRVVMMVCFLGIMVLLIAKQLGFLALSGTHLDLRGLPLGLGFLAMLISGMLTSAGIGLFVLVQSTLFLLNVSPFIAFPIMTTAGALQQPLSTLVFLRQGKIPLKKTLVLSIFGCLGVVLTLSFFSHMQIAWLHFLLLFIVMYNFFAMTRSYLQERSKLQIEAISTSG